MEHIPSQHADTGPQTRHERARAQLVAALRDCLDSIAAQRAPASWGTVHSSAESVAVLRGCIAEFAKSLRHRGESPERGLIAFKRELHDVIPESGGTDAFTRMAMGWCIEAYYAAEPPPSSVSHREAGRGFVSS